MNIQGIRSNCLIELYVMYLILSFLPSNIFISQVLYLTVYVDFMYRVLGISPPSLFIPGVSSSWSHSIRNHSVLSSIILQHNSCSLKYFTLR